LSKRADVKILLHVLAGITGHARDAAPLECCGLLAGTGELIDEYICTNNVRASEVEYQIDPVEHIAALKSLRVRQRTILGAYHSHPRSAAVPSATDLAEAHDAQLLYVIVSLRDEPPDIRAYRLNGGAFVGVSFAVI
jgi:[CysO sulfur-carrier protein]-S-L-cysteine hydrolase